ncbi:hypothetical protein OH779_00690 [Actinacidiphila glaucinigra]|uniref:hypothetical protein n=1 Tax=Actinacidiphila glaucinigra TaxID=235986 RepID=UPI0038662B73
MSSLQTYELVPGTRYRGVDGLGQVLIYTPHKPALQRYNRAVWLVLELAVSGRSLSEIEAETLGVLGDTSEDCAKRVCTSLKELLRKDILRAVPPVESAGGKGGDTP